MEDALAVGAERERGGGPREASLPGLRVLLAERRRLLRSGDSPSPALRTTGTDAKRWHPLTAGFGQRSGLVGGVEPAQLLGAHRRPPPSRANLRQGLPRQPARIRCTSPVVT